MELERKARCLWKDLTPLRRPGSMQTDRASSTVFERDSVERYCRQMLMPKFGVDGQQRLMTTSVLVIGAGGLGCPAALYLAAAGVGRIGIVDRGDSVDRTNLHRQIGHADVNVGKDKTVSLAETLKRINPTVDIRTCSSGVSPTTVMGLIEPFDIILDCTDNVESRYMINDACALQRKPLISGSAIGFEGQLTVYTFMKDTPCYRCVFPTPPPPQCVGACDTAGVLGPVPGVIGTMQATEALKLAADIEDAEVLSRRLLLFDGLRSEMRVVKLRKKNPSCPVCGESEIIGSKISDPAMFDYAKFALGVHGVKGPIKIEDRVSAAELCKRRSQPDTFLLDVRPREQFRMCHVNGFLNVPLNELVRRFDEVNLKAQGKETIVICRRGNDSQEAVRMLQDRGLSKVKDVAGGLHSWHTDVDPSFPDY